MIRKFVTTCTMTAKTQNQEKYIKSLRNWKKPVVIATGPAGCGKTFLACQEGAYSLLNNKVSKLIITRPTKSVDEDHGFLPGNIDKKLAPWVQPIYDSLNKYEDFNKNSLSKLKSKIEIAPLGYMRGRTFDNSWIIADEMQNATVNQTKMLLTRIGENSKLIVTGDLGQTDIPYSGLNHFLQKFHLYDSELIDFIQLDSEDVVRHPVVKEILEIYDF
jgi:phosphate starvation-inducible protein PhoH and related proteins